MATPSAKGSTAPTITSALVAWPSRPVERSSPLSTPSTSIFGQSNSTSTTIPSIYTKSGSSSSTSSSASSSANTLDSSAMDRSNSYERKGKGKAVAATPEVVINHGEDGRRYPPPKRPLTPNQLGRIAQSFGIVIPSLPVPSPSLSPLSAPTGSTRRPTNITPTRPSPYLLTVIPPLVLLPSASTDEISGERSRRWKRGRLLPLQPTMGSMLLCIAREYGLPSTVGLGLYLVTPGHNPSSSSSSTSSNLTTDEPNGPLISSSTWSTLFSAYIMALSSQSSTQSRSSTPSNTPLKSSGPLGRDIPFPPSPLSLVDKHNAQRDRLHSFTSTTEALRSKPIPNSQSHSTNYSSSSSALPPTPRSATTQTGFTNMIVGSIEFDVDPDQAFWLADWKRSGASSRHRRNISSVSDSGIIGGGVKQLRLVRKVNDDKSRTLEFIHKERDREIDTISSSESAVFGATADTTLVTDDDDETENYKVSYMPNTSRRLSITQGDSSMAISVTASLDQYTEEKGFSRGDSVEDPTLLSPNPLEEDLLASPIKLDKGQLERVRLEMDKRGSGLIMADELDDLEKIMRQLSPREIRLTSPRAITPRMAAKVAAARVQAANLSLPAPPGSRPLATSPLASSSASDARLNRPALPSRPPITSRAVSDPPIKSTEAEPNLDRPAWPAVPFGSPHSPNLDDIFRPSTGSAERASPVSAETMQRMQVSPPRNNVTTEWRPPRPPRPKSPKLEHQRTLSHSLSPELIVALRSPTGPGGVGGGENSPEGGGRKGRGGRSNTVSIKGLRHQMSAKNLNLKWGNGDKDKERDVPDIPKETVGLFKGATEGATSSFASLKDSLPQQQPQHASSLAEFGVNDANMTSGTTVEPVVGSLPKHGFAIRFLSFGRKPSMSSTTTKRDSQRSVSAPKSSRRNPSHDGPIISPPITSTFHKLSGDSPLAASPGRADIERRASESPVRRRPSNANANGQPTSPRSPASPASPKSVKRKPVPGIETTGRPSMSVSISRGSADGGQEQSVLGMRESESLNSMRSFVLEDPPKRRVVPMGKAL